MSDKDRAKKDHMRTDKKNKAMRERENDHVQRADPPHQARDESNLTDSEPAPERGEMAKRVNQPPTGQGKKQSTRTGAENKLGKRSEVLQAAGSRQNFGTAEDEDAAMSAPRKNPKRAKAGR